MSDPGHGRKRAVVLLPPISAAALLAAGLAEGALAALVVAPIAVVGMWLGIRAARDDSPATPHRLALYGAVTLGAGLALAFGNTGSGLGVAFLGLVTALAGTRLSFEFDPPPARARVDTASPFVLGAVAPDLWINALWEFAGWMRPALSQRAGEEVAAAGRRAAERDWLERPELAHPMPPPLEKVSLVSLALPGAGEVEHLRFASEYLPIDPEIAAAYDAHSANRTAHVYLWRHRVGGPRPTLVSIHGLGLGRVGVDVHWLRVRGWDLARLHRELGMDVAYLILPLHGPRSLGRISGRGVFDGHPLVTNAVLGQAVWDLRRLLGWLRAQGSSALGVHGLSLGGAVAALGASLDGRLASAIPMIPAVDLPALYWRNLPASRRVALEGVGIDPDSLGRAWAPCAPLRHRPRVPFDARLIVGGGGDRITPPEQARALWEHWERPALHWFPGGHMLWRGREALQVQLTTHLCGTLMADIPPRVPPLTRFRRTARADRSGSAHPPAQL